MFEVQADDISRHGRVIRNHLSISKNNSTTKTK